MNKKDSSGLFRFVWRVEFIPYVVFTVIGAAVLYVVGSIVLGVIHNGGLIPPPTKLDRYECTGPTGNFSFLYLHGTDRVQIKSSSGLLEGTVSQNQFDWQGFANDRNVLGFAPPKEIVFEDSKSLRISGPDLKDVVCANTVEPTTQRRGISQ